MCAFLASIVYTTGVMLSRNPEFIPLLLDGWRSGEMNSAFRDPLALRIAVHL
jgi:hypothetical protein